MMVLCEAVALNQFEPLFFPLVFFQILVYCLSFEDSNCGFTHRSSDSLK